MRFYHILSAALVATLLASCMTSHPPSSPSVAKGYVVAEIDVTDREAYREYVAEAFPVIQKYGGRFLTRGGETIAVEGLPPAERVMIIEFASMEAARTFEFSPEYTAITDLRQRSARSRIFLIEGAPDPGLSAP